MKEKIKRFFTYLVLAALAIHTTLGLNPSSLDRALAADPEAWNLTYTIDSATKTVSFSWTTVDGAESYALYNNGGAGNIVDYTNPVATTTAETLTTDWTATTGYYVFSLRAFDNTPAQIAETNEVVFQIAETGTANILNSVPTYFLLDSLVEVTGSNDLAVGESTSQVVISELGDDYANDTPLPQGITVFGQYYTITPSTNALPFEIRIYYTEDELAGLDENQIAGILYYDPTNSSWQLFEKTGVKTENIGTYAGYVWAGVEDLDLFILIPVVDTTAPTSQITSFPAFTRTNRFDLQLTNSDGNGSGVDYVQVFYQKDGGEWIQYGANLAPTVTTVEFISPADGLYTFKSVATDKVGNVEEKLVADTQTTVDTVVLGQVANLTVTKTDSQLVLTWDKLAKAEGYVVKWGTDQTRMTNMADVKNISNVTFLSLDLTKTWYFQVIPYRTVNSIQEVGVSNLTSFTPPAPAPAPVVTPVQAPVTVVEKVQAVEKAEPVQPQVVEERTPRPVVTPKVAQPQPKVEELAQPAPAEEKRAESEPETRSWSRLIIVLLILLILAAAASGYYGYEWWMAKEGGKKGKKKATSKPKTRW